MAAVAGPQVTAGIVPHREEQDSFQSISSMPQHQAFSHEELRVNDYNHGKGPFQVVLPPESPFSAFGKLSLKGCPPKGFVSQLPIDGQATAFIEVKLERAFFGNSTVSRRQLRQPRRLSANVIHFDVGADKERVSIHENVIAPLSQFVRLALDKEWREAQTRVIPLPEDEPPVVQLYQSWLYFGHIECDAGRDKGTEYPLLTKAYVLGEKFMDAHFKDAILDCIVDKLRSSGVFDLGLANYVYDNTPEQSPLRRLWQDVYIWAGNATWLEDSHCPTPLNTEFVMDLAKRQMGFWKAERPPTPPFVQRLCSYHEHVNDVCYIIAIL